MTRARLNSAAVLALALVFWLFFQSSKQIPFLSAVNPFADDPFDAVGSFAIQAAGVLALLSVVRAFGFLSAGDEGRLLARTQLAAVLAVGITIASDAIGLLRHPATWSAKPGGLTLVALLAALACLTAAVGVACVLAARRHTSRPPFAATAATCVVAALVLFFYPQGVGGVPGALAAIGTGILALLLPLRVLATAVVPGDTAAAGGGYRMELIAVVVVAALAGLGAAVADSAEGGAVFVFISFELAAALVAYALLRRPLHLTLRARR